MKRYFFKFLCLSHAVIIDTISVRFSRQVYSSSRSLTLSPSDSFVAENVQERKPDVTNARHRHANAVCLHDEHDHGGGRLVVECRPAVYGRRARGPVLRQTGGHQRRRWRPGRSDRAGPARRHRGGAGRDGRATVSQQRQGPPIPVLVDETRPDHRARHRAQHRKVQIRGAHRHALHQGPYKQSS